MLAWRSGLRSCVLIGIYKDLLIVRVGEPMVAIILSQRYLLSSG